MVRAGTPCLWAASNPAPDPRRPRQGVLNWVAQPEPGVEPPQFEARLYDVLFTSQSPAGSDAWLTELNPKSLEVVRGAYATPALAAAKLGDRCASGDRRVCTQRFAWLQLGVQSKQEAGRVH